MKITLFGAILIVVVVIVALLLLYHLAARPNQAYPSKE